jgi:hypothetical protein
MLITAAAYADDLTPVSSDPEDFQKQLDNIYQFLKMYNMSMGPSKVHHREQFKTARYGRYIGA